MDERDKDKQSSERASEEQTVVEERRDAKAMMARCDIWKETKKQTQRRIGPSPARMLQAAQSTAEPNVEAGRCVFVGTGWRCVAALDACPPSAAFAGLKSGEKSAGLSAFWSVKCENAPSRISAHPRPKSAVPNGLRRTVSPEKAGRALIR
jgi:hypothetical protein